MLRYQTTFSLSIIYFVAISLKKMEFLNKLTNLMKLWRRNKIKFQENVAIQNMMSISVATLIFNLHPICVVKVFIRRIISQIYLILSSSYTLFQVNNPLKNFISFKKEYIVLKCFHQSTIPANEIKRAEKREEINPT